MDWPLIWLVVGLPVALTVMGWGTFAMIHADEARGRRRDQELRKRTSPNG